MALREMLAEFAIQVSGLDELDKADNKLGSLTKSFETFGGVMRLFGMASVVASGAALAMVPDLIKTGAEINTIANRLGVSTDELQRWRYMAEQTGAKANDLTLAMKMLEQHLSDSANGFKNKGFDHLGIKLKNTDGSARQAIDVLGDLAEKVSGMSSEADKTALALHTMGKGGIAMLPLLKQGREGVEKLSLRFKELGGGLSEKFVKEAQAAKGAQIDLSYATLRLKDHIGVQLLPAVTWITKKLTALSVVTGKVVANTNTMRTLMLGAGVASTITATKLGLGIASKLGLIEKVAEGASRGIWGTTKALGALGWQAAKFGLALAVVFLILEDFYTFMTGGRSVIGEILDGWFGPGTQDKVRTWINELLPKLKEEFNKIKPYLNELSVATAQFLKDLFNGFDGYGKMFREFFDLLGEDIKRFWQKIEEEHPIIAKMLEAWSHVGVLGAARTVSTLASGLPNMSAIDNASQLVSTATGGGPIIQNNDTTINVSTSNAADAAKGTLSGIKEVNQDNVATLKAVIRPN